MNSTQRRSDQSLILLLSAGFCKQEVIVQISGVRVTRPSAAQLVVVLLPFDLHSSLFTHGFDFRFILIFIHVAVTFDLLNRVIHVSC